jgi:hypothetical protein
VEKGEKLGQLQFLLFISALQNPNFAWRSCSNRREKHRTAFANIVEGCLLYNFRIYRFCRTVQIFGETHGLLRPASPHANVSRSRPSPYRNLPRRPFSSQTGSSPEQSSPLSWSLRAAARLAAGVPPPVFDHKPIAGEPLVLPHLIPGQTRRRSRPIQASRAALHAQGLHCVSLFPSRVFFREPGA